MPVEKRLRKGFLFKTNSEWHEFFRFAMVRLVPIGLEAVVCLGFGFIWYN